ncbi:glycoside hydrolase family 31 protein [Parasediminibacterium sp. JCM 36343]|uniref:glycoside hydrolase family 31 protein n=1 Tax=Parasediminibacterium sp. JCM 36343 TaxID=3374279 RepID=UPI00397B457B
MKRFLFFAIAIFIIQKAPCQMNRLSEQAGNVVKETTIDGGVEFKLSNAYARILAYNATTIRIRVSKTAFTDDRSFAIDNLKPTGVLQAIKGAGNDNIYKTDSLMVRVHTHPFRISIYNNNNQLLCADESTLGISWFGNQVSCYKQLNSDEKFIGLGEKTGGINRRGNFYQNWNTDAPAYANNADPLYATIPFFIGTHDRVVYGVFFDNSHKSYFNFGGGADEELFHFGADDGEMNYYVFGGSSVASIIKDYTTLTGRTPMPPLWSLGFQQSRWGYDNQEQLLTIAKTFREKKLPADVIVSDINYMDDYKVFTWSNKYPDVKGMLGQMKQMGFDMVTIIDPGIKVEKGYTVYEDGLTGNHFAKYPGGKPYIGHVWPGRCHFPDFTKISTREWWGNNFKEAYINRGVRGFWNDMNEPAAWGREFPNLIEFGEGKDRQTLYGVKNAYGLLMAKATYEGTRKGLGGQRPFVLTRASYSGVQKYSAQWTGDNVSTDEHMLLGFRLLNSMGVSGIPFTGMDIGGFMGNPTPELFLRWLSLSLYSPLFRNHTAYGYNYREPWLFGEYNTEKIRAILEKRYQLLPHLYSAFYQSSQSGMPINRMLPIDYTYDDYVYNAKYENQFMFGDGLLVCPVTSTQTVADVYLPSKENWYRLSSDKLYAGGSSYFVECPLEDAPVFVKGSSIIPMQSTVQNTKEKGDGILYLHIYKGSQPNTYTYYEDDGETYQYETDSYYRRAIAYNPTANTITLKAKEGNYASKFAKVKLVLHGFESNTAKEYGLNDGEMVMDLGK